MYAMTLIETKTLASAAASITFTSIPGTYTDLLLVLSLRGTRTGFPIARTEVSINGTSTNEFIRFLRAFTTQSSSGGTATEMNFAHMPSADNTANTFSNTSIYFLNYAGSTPKSISFDSVSESNNTADYSQEAAIGACLWNNTAAITSISMAPDTGNLAIGSTASLYGILKGSSGGVVVS
jgi:hypothetical protein